MFIVIFFQILHEYKFEFLRIVCSHEHFIPLSLPLMRKGLIKTYKGKVLDTSQLLAKIGKLGFRTALRWVKENLDIKPSAATKKMHLKIASAEVVCCM